MKEKELVATLDKKESKSSLYPERMFSRADRELERLRKLENGEIETLELSNEEREEILHFEDLLGSVLARIKDIKINSSVFYPEYFLTEEGRIDFKETVGIEIEGENIEQIKYFLSKNRAILNETDGKLLAKLVGNSKSFSEESLLKKLREDIDENGKLELGEALNPERLYVVLNPENALDKIQSLRDFKSDIGINNAQSYHGNSESENLAFAKEKIKDLYRKKANVMIASEAHIAAWANQLSLIVGGEGLSAEEEKLSGMYKGMQSFEKTLARYDRFVHGSDIEYDEKGMKMQMGRELDQYISVIEEKCIHGELERDECIREKGLDPVKLEQKNIDLKTFTDWTDKLLEAYGEKSSFSGEDYDPKRLGPASDGKWQFVARDSFKSMSVNAKQKVIKSGTKNKPITDTLATLLGHEGTHFVQALNQSKAELKLISEIGGDRSVIFSEGGAMMVESLVTKELFGFEYNPHPHYIKAMKKRLEGGTYLECAKAFYDSALKIVEMKRDKGILDEKRFSEEVDYWLRIALDRAKRLLHGNEDFAGRQTYLTKSKDTVYAEQAIIMEKLKKAGMEKYAFIKGVNLDALATLAEIGILNLSDIQEPKLEPIREIWEQEKHKYLLAEKEPGEDEKIAVIRKNIETLD